MRSAASNSGHGDGHEPARENHRRSARRQRGGPGRSRAVHHGRLPGQGRVRRDAEEDRYGGGCRRGRRAILRPDGGRRDDPAREPYRHRERRQPALDPRTARDGRQHRRATDPDELPESAAGLRL